MKKKGQLKISTMLRYRKNKNGARVYSRKASTISKQNVQHLVKLANDRLYKMEKSGVASLSKAYQTVQKYAVQGQNKMYNVNKDRATVRFTKDINRVEDKAKFINTLRNFLTSTTSTIGGTKKAYEKAYQSFINRPDLKGKTISRDTFRKLAVAYRTQLSSDVKERLGSDVIVQFAKELGEYDISDADISTIMRYAQVTEDINETMVIMQVKNPEWFSEA